MSRASQAGVYRIDRPVPLYPLVVSASSKRLALCCSSSSITYTTATRMDFFFTDEKKKKKQSLQRRVRVMHVWNDTADYIARLADQTALPFSRQAKTESGSHQQSCSLFVRFGFTLQLRVSDDRLQVGR